MAGVKRKADEMMEPATDDVGPVLIPPYDVSKEDFAQSVVLRDDYIKLKKGIKNIAGRLTEPLKKSEYRDAPSVTKIIELTEARLTEDISEPIMVSISGKMGSGKSSTINSIFSAGMIARSDKSGSSVTLVPHLYCGSLADQSHRFMIEVQFFNQQERKKFFESELAAFYRAGCQDESDECDMIQRTNGNDDDPDTRHTVTDAIYSVFLDQKECNTKRATREFLKSAKSEDDKNILKKLNRWADKLICSLTEDQESVMLQASTPQEMLKKSEMYSTEVTDDDNQRCLSLWPLVRLIKVYFENPLGKMGISILDAPGSSDNHIRRDTALTLKRECSHAAIVVDVARANNEGVVSREVNTAKGKGEGRVIVIVTSSDKVDSNTLVGGNSKERQEVNRLKANVERLQSEADALMVQLAVGADNDLYRKQLHLDVRLRKEQNKEKAARIAMRSENTKVKLQEKLVDVISSQEPIAVISISYVDYQKHLTGHNTLNPPTLSVAQTQIPELRRQFAQFPNEARLGEIRHLFKTLLPSAISRLVHFSDGTASARKADIVARVQLATKRYTPIIENALERVERSFEHDILGCLRTVEDTWMQRADGLCDQWKDEYKPRPFLTLMNRNGLRRHTKRSDGVNLSGQLVNIIGVSTSEILSATIKRMVSDELGAVREGVSDVLSDLRKGIIRDDSAALVDVQPYLDLVNAERLVVKAVIERRVKELSDGLNLIKARFTTDVEDNYLAKQMLPVYEKVRVIKGGKDTKVPQPKIGWVAQRHRVLKQEIKAPDGVWMNTCMAMEKDFRSLVESTRSALTTEVGVVFKGLLSGFDERCDAADLDETTQKALQALLRSCLEEVNNLVRTELDPAWETLVKSDR